MPPFAFRRARLFPALLVALTGCGSTTNTLPSVANPLDSEESAAIFSINALRTSMSLPPVTVCASLNVSASAHSDDMRDNGYFGDSPPNNPTSTVRTRACAAGYKPSCTGTIPMAELVDEGDSTGAATVSDWTTNMMSQPILVQANLTFAGIGRSTSDNNEYWTLDMASVADPSCN